jgi:hypothetical protein
MSNPDFINLCEDGTVEEIKSFKDKIELEEGILTALNSGNYKVIDYLLTLKPDLDFIFDELLSTGEDDDTGEAAYLSIKTKYRLNDGLIAAIETFKIQEVKTLVSLGANNFNHGVETLLDTVPNDLFNWVCIENLNYLIKSGATNYKKIFASERFKFVNPYVLNMNLVIKTLTKNKNKTLRYDNIKTLEVLIDRGLPYNLIRAGNFEQQIDVRHNIIKSTLNNILINNIINIICNYATL